MLPSEKSKKDMAIKSAIFLNLIGVDGLQLFNSFNLSDKDREDCDKIMEAFDHFCNPKKNIVFERFKFNQRNQKQGENFDSFLAAIQKLIKNCEYKDQESSILRDRIVLGISDRGLQKNVLGSENLDDKRAIEICRAVELTRSQAKEVQNTQSSAAIDEIKNEVNPNSKFKIENSFVKQNSNYNPQLVNKCKNNSVHNFKCFRCGTTHQITSALRKQCRKCGKDNHFEKQCKLKLDKNKISQVSHVRG